MKIRCVLGAQSVENRFRARQRPHWVTSSAGILVAKRVKAKNDPLKLLHRPLLRASLATVQAVMSLPHPPSKPAQPLRYLKLRWLEPPHVTQSLDPRRVLGAPKTSAGRPKEGGRQPMVVKTTDNGGNKADFRQ